MKYTILFLVLAALVFSWTSGLSTQDNQPAIDPPLAVQEAAATTVATDLLEPVAVKLIADHAILQSRDGGEHWEPLSQSLPAGILVKQLINHNGTLVAVTFNSGLWRKVNAFSQWMRVSGREVEGRILTAIYHQDQLWVSTNGIGLSVEFAPGMWLQMNKPPGSSPVRSLYAGKGYVLAGTDTGIFRRTDSGGEWVKVFGDYQCIDLAGHNNVLIAGTRKGLAVSTDAGEHWSLAQEGEAVFRVNYEQGIFAGMGAEGKVLLSADDATSWYRCGPTPSSAISLLGDPNGLLMSNEDGVYRSTDGGHHWELIAESPNLIFGELLRVGNVVYGTTFNPNGC